MKIKHASDAPAAAMCPDCAEAVFGKSLHAPNYQKRLADWTKKRERRFFIMLAVHVVGLLLAATGLMAIVFGVAGP